MSITSQNSNEVWDLPSSEEEEEEEHGEVEMGIAGGAEPADGDGSVDLSNDPSLSDHERFCSTPGGKPPAELGELGDSLYDDSLLSMEKALFLKIILLENPIAVIVKLSFFE